MSYSANSEVVANAKGLNQSQSRAWDLMHEKPIVCLVGPPGCGKTFVAMKYGATAVKMQKVKNIIYIRSPMEMGRSKLGHLPGDVGQKMDPYVKAMSIIAKKLGISEYAIQVFAPGYIQGITFDDAVIVVDECQIFDIEEFKAIVSRLGKTSRMIFCGDPSQDTRRTGEFPLFLDCVQKLNSVGIQYFNFSDNQRHPVINEIYSVLPGARS